MNGTRLARNASAAMVAGIAAWSSYSHMVHVALGFGERPEVAWLLPLSVDGMLVVASVAMVDDRRHRRRVRPAARVAFVIGVAASVAANIAAAEPHPPARGSSQRVAGGGAAAAGGGDARPHRPRPAGRSTRRRIRGGTGGGYRAGRRLGSGTRNLARGSAREHRRDSGRGSGGWATERQRPHRNGVRRPAAVTRKLATDILNAEPDITRTEIAARLGVSTRRLREVLASEP